MIELQNDLEERKRTRCAFTVGVGWTVRTRFRVGVRSVARREDLAVAYQGLRVLPKWECIVIRW